VTEIAVRSAVAENPMIHANLIDLSFIQPELYGRGKFDSAGIGIFDFFCFCDLDLDPMTFIYDINRYSREIHRMCKYELPASSLSKVIV